MLIEARQLFLKLVQRKFKAGCGHLTRKTGIINYIGEIVEMSLPVEDGGTDYCHKCIESMSIQCAWCGLPIFIGDAITLYSLKEGEVKKEYAKSFEDDPSRLVGCLRWNCAVTGADRQGFWYPPGKVLLVLSPIQMSMKVGEISLCNPNDMAAAIEATYKNI